MAQAAYEGGASQFVGGGFMPVTSPTGAGGSAQKNRDGGNKTQTVRRLTIKQLHASMSDPQGYIDGKEVANVAVIGKVIKAWSDAILFNAVIDDGSGSIMCRYYINEQAGSFERQRVAELREGIYVRAYGHFTGKGPEAHLVAFTIRPVVDYNEVTYHLAQTIFQHLHLTKGTDTGTAGPADAAQAHAGYGAMPFVNAAPAPAYAFNSGMSPIQAEVLKIFTTRDEGTMSPNGISVEDVIARSGNRFNAEQIMSAIQFLVDEGQLYTTDNTRWKACMEF